MPGESLPPSFTTTRWSVILRAAGGGTDSERIAALDALCRAYWYPLYAFLRRSGRDPADAEDLVQGFLVRLLDGSLLGHISASAPGRFRAFLLTALKNFATDAYRAANALKRGGDTELIPLETALAEEKWQLEADSAGSPELAYDRAWANATLAAAQARLRAEHERAGKLPLFEALWPLLSGGGTAAGHEEIAPRLGLSPGAVATAATRLRERYAEAIRAEISHCVGSDAEVDDELNHLLGLFS